MSTADSVQAIPNPSHVLSPKQLAQVIGASESSLKRWIDGGQIEASRTNGGHRRISVAEALRFIRSNGHPIIDPGLLGLEATVEAPNQSLTDRLEAALIAGNTKAACTLLVSAYATGIAIAELGDGPIREAMERIGKLWLTHDTGIMHEHQALDSCFQAVLALRGYLREAPIHAPLALGAAPSHDPYLLPSMLAATTLYEVGYRTINLGADTPLESLRHAVNQHQPRVVWLAVSTAESAANIRAPLLKLIDELALRRISVIVGGRHATDIGLEPRSNLLRSRSLSEVAAFARGLLGA